MIWAIVGACIAILMVTLWCCLKVASDADDEMEKRDS